MVFTYLKNNINIGNNNDGAREIGVGDNVELCIDGYLIRFLTWSGSQNLLKNWQITGLGGP